MSNLGLERALSDMGGKLLRTAVGDRYVVEAMRQNDLNLGGEQSGHLVFLDHMTTGDGIIAALQSADSDARRKSAAFVAGQHHAAVSTGAFVGQSRAPLAAR